MSKSSIEWTEDTWNPIVGCSILSPGCTNCYAMKMAARIQKMNRTGGSNSNYVNHYDGTTRSVNGKLIWTGKLALAPDKLLLQPLSRKKPTTYFVNSMGDLFHEDCPDEWIDKVFAVMALAPQHTFQVLTKRAQRMRDYMSRDADRNALLGANLTSIRTNGRIDVVQATELGHRISDASPWPLPNVWLGVSTERQQEADERIPLLLQTPAATRFISAEPLLGPINIGRWLSGCHECAIECGWRSAALDYPAEEKCNHCGEISKSQDIDEFCPKCDHQDFSGVCPRCGGNVVQHHPDTPVLDWVIVGGESGPEARPMHPDWARSLKVQCEAAGVPFFFKQWGSHAPARMAGGAAGLTLDSDKMVACNKKSAGRALDGIEYNEMPEVAR